jgi:uncharacterized protein
MKAIELYSDRLENQVKCGRSEAEGGPHQRITGREFAGRSLTAQLAIDGSEGEDRRCSGGQHHRHQHRPPHDEDEGGIGPNAAFTGPRTAGRSAPLDIEAVNWSYPPAVELWGPPMMNDFIVFAIVGFVAQLIDGSLGMGYGVISSSLLLAQGVPPALASASVNAAKLPTTGTAALSHYYHGNIEWPLVRNLALFGALGGIVGALILTSLKGFFLALVVNLYLAGMGVLIIWRGLMNVAPRVISPRFTRSIGVAGGLVEGIGGSWGPIVTTSLLGAGKESRFAIGSCNFSEFVVSAAVFSAFMLMFAVGHWGGAADWRSTAYSVAGLVVGGLPAAVFGGYLSKRAPRRILTVAVGCLALGIAAYRSIYA